MNYQKIIVLSDLHINTNKDANWLQNNQSVIDAVTFINTYHTDAAYCVVLGDLIII